MKAIRRTIVLLLGLGSLSLEAKGGDREPNETFDLTFFGGTPTEFAAAIKKAGEQAWKVFDLNVLIPTELNDIKIPPMQLRGVDTRTVFQSLNMVSRSAMEWIPTSSAPGRGNVWVLHRR